MTKNLVYIVTFLISNLIFGQQKVYKIFNSEVNSKYAELGVNFLNAKTVIFASSKKTANDRSAALTKRLNKKQLLLEFYVGKLNDSSDIIETNRIENESFIKFNESDFALSPDKKTIYFCGYNYYTEPTKKTKNRQESIQLFKANIDANFNVSNVSLVTFSDPNYSIKNPSISKDGKKLFFAANMPDSYGYYDIYVSNILKNGTLSSPKNLGNTINTYDDDLYPFTDKNNTLYFASFGHKGQGSLDIFKSEFINGTYSKVENLPAPINSKSADFGYVSNPNNDTGFFVSNRRKGKGDVDIYGFKLVDEEIECNQLVTGLLIDKNTQKPVANATLKIYDANNALLESLTSAKDGSYQFKINCNETFKITAEKEYYTANEVTFETDATLDTEINKNIELTPTPCSQKVQGLVSNQSTASPIKNSTLKLYKNGTIISEKNTLDNALYSFELECNSEYIIIASKEGFHPTEIKIKTDNSYNTELTVNLALSPLSCNQTIEGVISNKLTKEPITDTTLKLYKNTTLITSETLNNRSDFNFELECEATYKISIQKEGFLDAEITITTEKQTNFTFTTNIELTPVECKQKISGTITNKTTKELLKNVSIKLFKNQQLIETQSFEENYIFKVNCNENYKIQVEKDGFETSEIAINTDKQTDFNFINNIELTPVECKQKISGTIANKTTKELLKNVSIKLFKNQQLIDTQSFEENYIFKVNCNENYKIQVEKDGFETSEIIINTDKQTAFNFINNIELTPIECKQKISGTITNKTTNELLKNVSIKLFKNQQLIDNQSFEENYFFNVDCNENYKILVEKDGFETSEITINTDKQTAFNFINNIELTPVECKQKISGTITNKTTKELLKNVSVKLFKNQQLIETQSFEENYFFNVDCNENYKILVEKTGFETSEITIKTDAKNKFNQLKNIELIPIICKQKISGTIANKTTKELLKNVSVKLFKNQQLIDTQSFEENYFFNVDCNENYNIQVEKTGFETSEIIINTDKQTDFNFVNNIELTPVECKQKISGTIANKTTKELLKNVSVKLFKNQQLIETQSFEENYIFNVDCNENYKIQVEKTGFETSEIAINTDKQTDFNFINNIELTPVECKQKIYGTIANKITKELLKNVSVKLFKNQQLIDTQSFEENYFFNVDCNENYKILVEKTGFETSEITINTDAKNEFNHLKNIELIPIICKQTFTGKIIDEITGNRLNNLNILLFENNLLKATIDLKDLQFKFDLDCNTSFKIRIEKPNYESTEVLFSTDTKNNFEIEKIIKLKPIECYQTVKGIILDKKTNIPIPTATITVFSEGTKLDEINVNTDGSFNFKLDCKVNYNLTVSSRGYQTKSFGINPTLNYNIVNSKTIHLNPQDEFVYIRNQKMVKTNKLNFELNQDIITPTIAVEINKVVAVLQNYPSLKIEVKSHTDSRAPDNYSLELSNNRAASIISYIVSKGIDTSRVFGKGYGETELINGCSNGVRCSEKDHLINRRTEFIVIEE
ncbi:OmpA family protein [Lutibacter sp. A80]|uniref:carboxypeptidase regulatory-like domain-containing protein n=1 Tax=Lutibacter sp. A80 TaxID=2918453 RepID=UPI001F054CDB|nr:carboxypeptidase regulatory-like domain-containing protein [Lutibacter sp. A80]UMB60742.1 OmpA family protein [Lutibacter sp. A80]